MNDSPLPDDLAAWPTDPHELLGVEHGVAPRDLKRAYARLAKLYKPERAPEQFRRIREAYETLLRFTEFREAIVAHESLGQPTPIDSTDEANDLWERAIAGDMAGAYSGLIELRRRRPNLADIPLRLYWLLALEPDLARGKAACSWLVEALCSSGLDGPAAALYGQELDERPEEALREGARMLDVDVPPARLADAAVARWRTASRLRRWSVLRDDLAVLGDRVKFADEVAWLRLMFAAMDALAWSPDDPLAAELLVSCRREIEGMSHLQVRFADDFDRLEFLGAAVANWPALRARPDFPADLLDLLQLAWSRPFVGVRSQLIAVMARVAEAPQEWLTHLDELAQQSPAALSQFGGLLEQLQDRRAEPPPIPHAPEGLQKLARLFLDTWAGRYYHDVRPALLEFCMDEAVGPEHLAAVAPDRPSAVGEPPLGQLLASDWPLRCVCWACRLFWE